MCSSFEAVCPKHAVSLHLDMHVCARARACAGVCLRVSDQEWLRGLSVSALALKEKLYFCVHMCGRDRVVVVVCCCCCVCVFSAFSPHMWSQLL